MSQAPDPPQAGLTWQGSPVHGAAPRAQGDSDNRTPGCGQPDTPFHPRTPPQQARTSSWIQLCLQLCHAAHQARTLPTSPGSECEDPESREGLRASGRISEESGETACPPLAAVSVCLGQRRPRRPEAGGGGGRRSEAPSTTLDLDLRSVL